MQMDKKHVVDNFFAFFFVSHVNVTTSVVENGWGVQLYMYVKIKKLWQ